MNVLLVTHRYPPEGVGGVERYVERLALELRRRGERTDVLTRVPRRLPRRPRLERNDGVYGIVGSGVRLREFLLEHEAVERAFCEVLAEARPNIVHVNHLIGISPKIVALARRAEIPVVLSVHDYYAACPLAHLVKADGRLCDGPDGGRECAATCFADEGAAAGRWTIRFEYFAELLQIASAVVCPTERLAGFLRPMAPRASFEVIGLGVPAARGSAAPPSSDRLTFAHVGTASRHKGVFRILAAIERAALGDIHLLVLGRFVTARERREFIHVAAGVPGLSLELGGEFDAAALPQLLGGVAAVIAASEVPEAFPLAPREALAVGVPVLAARLGGLVDVIEPEVNGVLFEPRSTEALAQAIRRVAVEPGLQARLAAGARVTEVPTFAAHVDALSAVYRRVIAGVGVRSVGRFEQLHTEALAAGFGRSGR